MCRVTPVLFVCSIAVLNCGAQCLFPSPCTLPVVFPGVYVQVLNDETGEGIPDAIITITTAERTHTETLSGGDAGGHYVGGYGLTGTLTLTVEAAGFVSQQEDVVVKTLPGCQIVPADLTVRLIPSTWGQTEPKADGYREVADTAQRMAASADIQPCFASARFSRRLGSSPPSPAVGVLDDFR